MAQNGTGSGPAFFPKIWAVIRLVGFTMVSDVKSAFWGPGWAGPHLGLKMGLDLGLGLDLGI